MQHELEEPISEIYILVLHPPFWQDHFKGFFIFISEACRTCNSVALKQTTNC